MKKIISISVIIILIFVFLCGCDEDSNQGLVGSESDLIGTWKTESGSFAAGDSIRFNEDKTCDFFWSPGGSILFSGTWEKTINVTNGAYILIITTGEKVTTYYYSFFDSYKTLRLREESGGSYIYYSKQ